MSEEGIRAYVLLSSLDWAEITSRGGAYIPPWEGGKLEVQEIKEREREILPAYGELVSLFPEGVQGEVARLLLRYQEFQLLALDLLSSPPRSFAGFGVITSDEVNLRAGPGGRYPLEGRLSRGQTVVVQGEEGYWVRVWLPGGREGYVFRDYVQREG